MSRLIRITLTIVVAGLAMSGAFPVGADTDALHGQALRRLASGTPEDRRVAIELLDQATRLEPGNAEHWLRLGRACELAQFDHRALDAYRAGLRLRPESGDAHRGLARVWKHMWLSDFDPASLDSAHAHAESLVAVSVAAPDLILCASLAYESGAAAHAGELARHALEAAPDLVDAQLLAAQFAWRRGSALEADRLFSAAIPRLPHERRARYEDMGPLLTEADAFHVDGLSPEARTEFLRRFWSRSDPDPTTEWSEARLEYWARLTHVLFLYAGVRPQEWDTRAELYARYGAPGAARYEPVGRPLAARLSTIDTWWNENPLYGPRRLNEPLWVPFHAFVLDYPELGMRVELRDQYLGGDFDLRKSVFLDTDPEPAPYALANSELVATPGARGVFPLHPPGVPVLPIGAVVSRFQDARGGRLLAQVEAAGAPDDSLWAEAVAIDSSERVVGRATQALPPSACDPAEMRACEFDFPLAPGPHRVAVAVHGRSGARGLARMAETVDPPARGLAMSDVVVTCGSPADMTHGTDIRLQPNVARRVHGDDPLVAYFEVYNLASDAGGAKRFEYRYTIRPANAPHRNWFQRLWRGGADADVSVRSRSEGRDSIRRQFVSAPMRTLGSGAYLLTIEVRDLNSGTRTSREVRIVKS